MASLLRLPSLSHAASNDMAATKGTIAARHAANIKRLQDWIAMEKLGRVQLRPAGSALDAAMQRMVGPLQAKIAA